MKLCYIAPATSIHTQRWLRAFVGRGHEVHLLALSDGIEPIEGVATHALGNGTPKVRFAQWVAAIRQALQRIQPDLLHGHYLTRYGWLAAASGFRPLVLTAWGSDAYVDPQGSRLTRLATQWSLRQACLVTADAADLAQQVKKLGATEELVEVVQWGVDIGHFHPNVDTAELRARLDLASNPIVLCTRGLKPNYGQDVLLRAMPAILAAEPGARLVLKYNEYDPAYLAQLHDLASQPGLAGSVRFVGDMTYGEMPAYYAAASVFVSLALSDGTPVSLLEAMACGAVPVVSDLPSIREWIEDGKNGFCVPPRSEAEVSAAVLKVLASPGLREKIRATNERIVRQRADHEQQMNHMEKLYTSIVDRHSNR